MVRKLVDGEVPKWTGKIRRIVTIGAALLGIIYGFLTLSSIPYDQIIGNIEPNSLMKVIIAVYFVLWVYGMNNDINIQENIYSHAPYFGKVRNNDYDAIAIILIFGVILFGTVGNNRLFSTIFAIFIISNIILWRYLIFVISESLQLSEEYFSENENWFKHSKISAFRKYISGNWQKYRFFVMLILIAIMNIIAWSSVASDSIIEILHIRFNFISKVSLSHTLFDLCFLLFVFVAESWVWHRRYILSSTISVLDELEASYFLVARQTKASRDGAA